MKIIVLVKEVPDTYGARTLDLETGLAERAGSDRVLDEIGERAVEAAVAYAEKTEGVEVVVLSMGPETVPASVRKALAIGADSAVHVLDDRLRGADLTLTAEVLARAIEKIGYDLVLTGNLSTDGVGGVVPAMIAEHLGVPQLTALTAFDIEGETITGDRASDGARLRVSAGLPAVVSVTEALPDPRFPNFKGLMAAKKKPFETWSLDELGVSAEPDVPRSIMLSVAKRPERSAGVTIVDDGEGGTRLAEFLIEKGLV